MFYVCFHQSIIVFIITKRFGSYTTTFISGIIIITKNILLFILHNGYPERFIHSSRLPKPRPISPAETEGLTTLTLPYLKGPSEAIRRVLEPLNIRTFFRPTRTLRQILCHPKDPVPDHQQAGVVYKIPCSDCSKSYIGQTGRTLAQRVKEHQRAVRTFDVNVSALAEHVISTNHKIDWDNTTVID